MPKQPCGAATPLAPTAADTSSAASDAHLHEPSLPPAELRDEAQVEATDLELETPSRHKSGDVDREVRIRSAAYAAYLRRGGESGDAVQDWLEAEREVDAEATGKHLPG
jgi:hypothetical protein